MALVEYAKSELARIGDEDDEMQKAMNDGLIQIVEVFASQGHSGFSGGYAIAALEKLLRFEPLTPLTGEDDEWTILDYDDDLRAQNKRCSRIFRRADGTAYDIEGRVFRDSEGMTYTNRDSRTEVTFPYVPTTEIVDVPAD